MEAVAWYQLKPGTSTGGICMLCVLAVPHVLLSNTHFYQAWLCWKKANHNTQYLNSDFQTWTCVGLPPLHPKFQCWRTKCVCVCVFYFFSLALPCLNIEIWGAGARWRHEIQVGLSLSIESGWGYVTNRQNNTPLVSRVSLLSFSPLFFSPLLKMNAILRKFISWAEPSLSYPAVPWACVI